ncbi:MAG: hypothetical protein Q9180_008465, partial [Flavoplaca navasiana]
LVPWAAALTVPPPSPLNPSDLAPILGCPPQHDPDTPNRRFPDPWVTHSPGQISTWEFYALHGHLPHHAALRAWRQAHQEVLFHARGGSVDRPLGTRLRHWVGNDEETGDIVDLVLHPGEELTWRMVGEAWRAANALICLDGRGFQFLVMAEGVEGEVAVGEMRARRGLGDTDTDAKEVEKRQVGSRMLRLPQPEVMRLAGANSTALTAISDPFIWSHTGMLSSWTFFGFFGHLDYNAAATAARQAFNEANFGHQPDDLIGAGLKTWTGIYHDAEPVALMLNARRWMTWRMCANGS